MSDLLLPEGTTVQAASDALSRHFTLRERGLTETERTFYDTFDGLLHGDGLVATHTDGHFSVGERYEVPWPTPPRRLLANELPPSPLRDALEPVIGVRALLPRARVRSRVHPFDVLNRDGKTIGRIALEEPLLVGSERRLVALRSRVRLTGVRGYDRQCARVRKAVERELGFERAQQPLADEAVIADGGLLEGISSKPTVKLRGRQPAVLAVTGVLERLWEVVDANLAGTIADLDSEFLHDFRVAIRRSRAVQRQLKPALPAEQLERFRAEFKWIQQVTGDARDMDVYVADFDPMRSLVAEDFRADLEPLLGVLRAHRLSARREMARELRSDRARELWEQWPEFLHALRAEQIAPGPAGAEKIGPMAGDRIARLYRRMVRTGDAIDDRSPPAALHELRKKGKELRYMLELFGAELFPSRVIKPMVKTLKGLQDVLGRHQDREVQAATVRSLREEVAALPGGPEALMAMGLLVEGIVEDQGLARAEFTARFAKFASKRQRKLVKETFG
ncbi:MAG TPA: CHAD domain-containing protein [Solirubrobacteraceae bacterium]|nr:CHAD domain-containing protein [Solirubrobacteraceae bacterium]